MVNLVSFEKVPKLAFLCREAYNKNANKFLDKPGNHAYKL